MICMKHMLLDLVRHKKTRTPSTHIMIAVLMLSSQLLVVFQPT